MKIKMCKSKKEYINWCIMICGDTTDYRKHVFWSARQKFTNNWDETLHDRNTYYATEKLALDAAKKYFPNCSAFEINCNNIPYVEAITSDVPLYATNK